MPVKIGSRRPHRLFLAEWRKFRRLTQKALAERMGTTPMTISRWELGHIQMSAGAMADAAEALDIAPADLWRDPGTPSADELLRGQPQEVLDQAVNLIRAIRRVS
jgi:transcriptional regulator with XRE-family HTH domain